MKIGSATREQREAQFSENKGVKKSSTDWNLQAMCSVVASINRLQVSFTISVNKWAHFSERGWAVARVLPKCGRSSNLSLPQCILQTFPKLWLVYHSMLWWVWHFKDIFAADLNPSGVFFICFTAHSGRACEVQGKLRHVFWKAAVVDWELSAAGTADVLFGFVPAWLPSAPFGPGPTVLVSSLAPEPTLHYRYNPFLMFSRYTGWLHYSVVDALFTCVSDIGVWRQLAGTTGRAAYIKD